MNRPALNEQMDAIRQGTLEIIPEDELARKIELAARVGRGLRVKQGFDPTRPDLHIGHAVSMRKLRTFQQLGHEVVFVVGDYTARIGDPSGQSETRPRLSPEEIEKNARTYEDQVGHILDLDHIRIEFNSKWLGPLDLADLLELTATFTVARMLERDDFAKRYGEGRPISVLEFMYPLMQAYDSVALDADVELGGTDQKFNLLVGRTVQERYGQEPQVCVIMPLIRGTDGVQKMSKSYDNYIGLAEPPEEQFGKTMSIPDDLLDEWIRLASGMPADAQQLLREQATTDPYGAKRALARTIVAEYHGEGEAQQAERHFDRVFREHAAPDDVPEFEASLADPKLRLRTGEGVSLTGLLVLTGLASSKSEAARLIEQGGVRLDQETVQDSSAYVARQGASVLLQRGRRRFVRVRFVA